MMRQIVLGTMIAVAALTASPAMAQTTGAATIGGGIGEGFGGFSSGAINTGNVSGTVSNSLNGSINNELSGSSGSGFGGTMNISSLPGGSSFAVFGGAGEAGTSITSAVNPGAVGSIESTSFNAGGYGGLTGGNASLNMQVMNFGQSAADYKFNLAFAAANTEDFNATSADWNLAGAAGPTAFAFGSLGWTAE